MEPSLQTGAIAVTRPISPQEVSRIRVGTVVAFRSLANPEMLIMHRVIARTANGSGDVQFVTKGDANVVEDSLLLDSSRVVGTLSSSVSHAGYVVTALQRGQLLRLVLLAFVLVSAAVVLSNWATRSESSIKTKETT
jgi:signal peptidase